MTNAGGARITFDVTALVQRAVNGEFERQARLALVDTGGGGDANGDGVVDGSDFLLIQQKFGGPPAVPAVAAVPEPSSFLLALAAFGLPLAARRRRS